MTLVGVEKWCTIHKGLWGKKLQIFSIFSMSVFGRATLAIPFGVKRTTSDWGWTGEQWYDSSRKRTWSRGREREGTKAQGHRPGLHGNQKRNCGKRYCQKMSMGICNAGLSNKQNSEIRNRSEHVGCFLGNMRATYWMSLIIKMQRKKHWTRGHWSLKEESVIPHAIQVKLKTTKIEQNRG